LKAWSKRIFYDVRGSVSSGQRDGDDEVRRDEAEEDKYKKFALPTTKQAFEHRN